MPTHRKPKPKSKASATLGITGDRKKTLRLDQGLLDREQQVQGLRALAALGPIDAARIAD